MLKRKKIKSYTVEASIGPHYPLLIRDKQFKMNLYNLNHQDGSYFLVDLLFSGRKEKGNFAMIDDVIYLFYEEPPFYI